MTALYGGVYGGYEALVLGVVGLRLRRHDDQEPLVVSEVLLGVAGTAVSEY
jgi:hypothetical protein